MSLVPESATIVNALRSGLVPSQGLDHFATGLEAVVDVVNQELDFVATGKGLSKWIRGEYGTGRIRWCDCACCRCSPELPSSPRQPDLQPNSRLLT